ncbi:uncharacterized protein [Nicotiana tomentosiformis]|uniref:uncharacterized protein n=1 Tax=Nicotiana tomentosiformis TaxID=4098 RepID=UPI00388CB41F
MVVRSPTRQNVSPKAMKHQQFLSATYVLGNQQKAVTQRSPINRRSPGMQDQVITPKHIEFSNSFDALLNEHDHVLENSTDAGRTGVVSSDVGAQSAVQSTKPNELLERVENSSRKKGVDGNKEEGCSSVTRKKKETSGIKSPDQTAEKSSKNENGQIVVVADECKVSRNSIAPTNVNLTAIGAEMLEGLNPLQVLPGFLSNPTKGMSLAEVNENNGMTEVGLNTSQHDIPSNDLFDQSGNMLQVSNNQQTLSMMSSATKKGGDGHTREEHEDTMSEAELSDEPVQILNELQEAISSKLKSWADQVEEYGEGEEDYGVDSQEQNTQQIGSSIRRGDNAKEGAITVFEQIASTSPSMQIKIKLSPNAAVFVPTGQQLSCTISNLKLIHKTGQVASTSGVPSQYSLTPTNILRGRGRTTRCLL